MEFFLLEIHKWCLILFLTLKDLKKGRKCSYHPIFFEQVGHQNTYASIGYKIFFTKWCHCQIYQNYEPVIFQHLKSTEFFLRRILHRKIIGQKSPNVLYECSPPFSCNNTLTLFQTSLAFHITRRHHNLVKTAIKSHPSTYLAMKFTCDFS